jgi:demethylmenaquinone methyltransferase/2-methoxy-6-polyprenyl-1,4-benzoquinol methylase
MTLSFDAIWRRRLLSKIEFSREMMILDLACGTGLVTYALSRQAKRSSLVVGLDLSSAMLSVAKDKKSTAHTNCQVEFVRAVGEFLPFRSNLFSYVTVGLALRNFANKLAMLKDALRVLTHAGWFLSVDFVRLQNPYLWRVYRFHLFHTLPALGRLVSKYWARTLLYLANSIQISTSAEEIRRILIQVGYRRTSLEKITLGVVALLAGQK